MNKKILLFLLIFLIIIVLIIVYSAKGHNQSEFVRVDGIENFSPETVQGTGDYFLIYPRDLRVSQDFTLVKEVEKSGKVIRKYKIFDEEFSRMLPHQKPNNMNQLYISFFGDTAIDNYYFTYDIPKKSFKKVNVDYFNFDVGIDHIMHYGNDIILQTIMSHKTGDQNYNEKIGGHNVSISNATTKKSFETEYRRSPLFAPILNFKEKLIYGTTATLEKNDEYAEHGIAIVDLKNDSVRYETFGTKDIALIPLFSTSELAYILGENGKMYVYDKDFHYTTYEPFKNLPQQQYYDIYENGQLALDDHRILYCLRGIGAEETYSLGILNLEGEPNFQLFNADFANTKHWYEPLYQNLEGKEIYVKEMSNNKDDNHVIILDSESLKVKAKIPVDSNHLLDFIVKINH